VVDFNIEEIMSTEDIQLLLAEFNKQFNELRKDLNSAIEKISDKMIIIGEANISCSKDIEATRSWYEEKTKDMEKDINGIGESVRRAKIEIMASTEEKIKSGNLSTRLLFAGSFMSAMGALILLLANKFL